MEISWSWVWSVLNPFSQVFSKKMRKRDCCDPAMEMWRHASASGPCHCFKDFCVLLKVTSAHLLIRSDSRIPCTKRYVLQLLCVIKEAADLGKTPRGQDVWKMASSLSFLRTYSVGFSHGGGLWSLLFTFVNRYLTMHDQDVPCMTMGTFHQPRVCHGSLCTQNTE